MTCGQGDTIMQNENRTVVGIFSDITAARRAIDELHGKAIVAARLVENDQTVTFTGTAEREASSSGDYSADEQHRGRGVRGFLARLFGYDDNHADWKLSSDTESYFRNAYDKNSHLIIIENCSDASLCREIISRMGGVVEEQGSDYFHKERSSDLASGKGSVGRMDRPHEFDESLNSSRRSAADHAADSGLGVDVDRMPFAHTIPPQNMTVSDRISQSRLSGTADHIPFTETEANESRSESENRSSSKDRHSTGRVTADADRMPFAGQSSETVLSGVMEANSSRDSSLGTGVSEPAGRSFADEDDEEDLLLSAERLAFVDRPEDSVASTGSRPIERSHGSGVPSDANSMPLAGRSLDTGVRASSKRNSSNSGQAPMKGDRALDGISGDADRTPLVGQLSKKDIPIRAGGGTSGDRTIDSIIIGDDRIHDRGVSNADVARLSSDRIMEDDEHDQHLVDEDIDELSGKGRRPGAQDRSLDNGHILPDHSFPPPASHPTHPS
jgi:hypothetical protein